MATVIGVFDTRDQAEKAVRAMRDKGFRDNEISVIAKRNGNQGGGGKKRGDMEVGGDLGGFSDVGEGAAWGGALGGIGGLLAGVGALTIPGVGPIVAAGPIAAALSGAVAGGVAGGLLDLGIPEERGRFFEEEVKKGKILAVVEADPQKLEEASAILRANGANNVESHVGGGKGQGGARK